MFNTSTYHAGNCTNNVKINAVTGAILKNHPKSWFERFNLKSRRADLLLVEGGHKYYRDGYRYECYRESDKDIVVLQMVICGDMEVMAELVYAKDYEMQFNEV